ncbi:hypothetical protein FQA39_LY04922 [Lamprigera yunnana]|nr:hypothetical protein FQA39_LY04922 [Lamprigera yunnana]
MLEVLLVNVNDNVGDNAIPAFRFYRSAQPRFPLEALSEAASAANADNSDIEDDVAETTSADIGDCDLWVPEDAEEDEENEGEDKENVENKISDSEIEASGNSRRTNKAISNLKCKKLNEQEKVSYLQQLLGEKSTEEDFVSNSEDEDWFPLPDELPEEISDNEDIVENRDDEVEEFGGHELAKDSAVILIFFEVIEPVNTFIALRRYFFFFRFAPAVAVARAPYEVGVGGAFEDEGVSSAAVASSM